MKKLIQYYDVEKPNQISIYDLAIDLSNTLPLHRAKFGDDNVAIYMDLASKNSLINIGIDCTCIKCDFKPLDNHYHSMRWLSILAMQTESFQICPLGMSVVKRATNDVEVSQLIIAPYIPVLAKYNLDQTGGMAGGDIISIADARITQQAYISARDVIFDNEIMDESEIQQIMGAYLYKTAKEMNINIVKYP